MKSYRIYFAWVIALVGTLASLYYAEVLGMEPCRLCWYQRIALFPQAFFLGFAVYRQQTVLALACLPLSLSGVLLAGYQVLFSLFPSLKWGALCGETTPCTEMGILPFFSLLAFLLISSLLFSVFLDRRRQ